MPNKLQFYSDLAEQTARQVTGSFQAWTGFLTTAARLYKYPFHEQLMIYAQRPEATACADYELWNNTMHRYVRRGSRGIALIDTSGDQPRLRYVFDVSDTGGGENSRRPNLWEYRDEHHDAVTAALKRRFDVDADHGLAQQLEQIAAQLADEYWNDNQPDILGIVDGSFLDAYDDFTVGVAFRNAAVVSTTYVLLSRCGLELEAFFTHEDFLDVFDFNTPASVTALGTAVSKNSEQALRQIEVAIRNYEREKSAERSQSHERAELPDQRGLSDPRSDAERAGGEAPGQVREDAEEVPAGASPGVMASDDPERDPVPPPAGDRRDGLQPAGADAPGAGEGGGGDGATESRRSDDLGGPDEHLQGPGGGDDPGRADLQLNQDGDGQLNLFPSEAEQIESIREAESASQSPSAFSLPQEDIDHFLRLGSNEENARTIIALEFMKQKPMDELTDYVKQTFHDGYGLIIGDRHISSWAADDGLHLTWGTSVRYAKTAQILSWEDAAVRIAELLEQGRFATNVELAEATGYERRQAAEALWYLCGDMSDEAREQGWMPTLRENWQGGFPETTERLGKLLEDQDARQTFVSELESFAAAWALHPELMRFRFYSPDKVLYTVKELSLPRREYVSGMAEIPAIPSFITEDEIDATLSHGGSYEGGAGRIFTFWQQEHTPKEKADFLKHEYGTGGGNGIVSHNFHSWEDHSPKGMVLKKPDAEDVTLSWAKVVKRIDAMMAKDRYLTPEAKAAWEQAHLEADESQADLGEQPEQEAPPAPEPAHAPPAGKLTQEDIDRQLRTMFPDIETKRAVVRYMKEHGREKETAAWLAAQYDGRGVSQPLRISLPGQDGQPGGEVTLSWAKVQRRIAQLIQAENFYTQEEYDRMDDVDLVAIREHLAQAGIVNGEVVDPEALDRDPFIRQVMADADDAVDGSQEEPPAEEAVAPGAPEAEKKRPGQSRVERNYRTFDRLFSEITSGEYRYLELRGGENSGYMPLIIQEIGEDEISVAHTYELGGDLAYDPEMTFRIDREKGTLEPLTFRQDGSLPLYQEVYPEPGKWIPRLRNELSAFTEQWLKNIENQGRRRYRAIAVLDGEDAEVSFDENGKPVPPSEHTPEERQTQIKDAFQAAGMTFDDFDSYDGYLVFRPEGGEAYTFPSWEEAAEWIDGVVFDDPERSDASERIMHPERFENAADRADAPEGFITPGGRQYHLGEEYEAHTSDGEILVNVRIENVTEDAVFYSIPEKPGNAPNRLPREDFDRFMDEGRFSLVHQDAELSPEPEQEAPQPAPAPPAENFRITDDHLGEGGPKTKFRANMEAINTLKQIEFEGRSATPEEQETLSRYVGWGGLADAFDERKPEWANEFKELYATLTPEEYAAARASTLNAHYTTPTVIRAIYEAVENMGFRSGNILEPAMGVGNFFGILPETMRSSRLYGVELDSITGRIAEQLYPKADITVAGFETTDRKDFYDLAVGNVPFGNYQVDDRAYNKLGFSIHNYFFAKALDQVRPGGLVAFLTSRYTMDAKDPTVRKYLAQRAELLGMIRLPNNAFLANAGTEVVSDIIFLQKRDRPIDITPEWVFTGQNKDGHAVNSYFLEHPEMVLGQQTSGRGMYGKDEYTVDPIPGAELPDQLHEAIQNIRGTYTEAELPELGEGEKVSNTIPADPSVKNYSYALVDGEVYYRENSVMVKPELNAAARERVKGMVELRDCVRELIDLQMDEYTPESAIAEKQAELNRLYDAFTAKYGLINDRGNRLAFSDDDSYYLLCSLEVLDENGELERKADFFTKRTIKQQHSVDHVDTAVEALGVSIGERACVDLPFMASLLGGQEKILQLVEELKGIIFKDPATGPFDYAEGGEHWNRGWQTADEYLSGNVRRKLRQAQRAAEQYPEFQVNAEALRQAQPKDLEASEIEVRLGTTWIDKEYFQQFMYETLDTPWYLQRKIHVNFSPYTAEWQIEGKSVVSVNDVAAYSTYGTLRANAYRLLEDCLNLRDTRIYDTVTDPDGKERRVLNARETTLAAQKQQLLKDAFRDWIWKDPERRATLVKQYNEEMNSTRPREYDGSHIVFSGMNPEITLRPHQRDAIAHILYGGNTLLAHEVGAGKTFEMVAAAMESKRLGLCSKSIFVVPNHLTDQWASEILRLYPSANVLVTTKKDFQKHNRKKFVSRIATGDYDAVVIGHSQFEKIPISPERQIRLIQEQIEEITNGIEEVKGNGGERFTVKELERTKKGLEARLKKLLEGGRKDDVVTFEELGVDRMFVDESDNYKNLFLYTKMRNVAGLTTTDAQKSSDMFAKCRYMDELTGGRGVVFATGTPISNSMTELYTIQRYLQYDRLQELGMGHFDCWASRFGETTTALELAPEGTGYRPRTRFAKFFNLPELMNMFKEVADIKTADQLHLPTPAVEYHNYVSKPTELQKEMVKKLSERASRVHSGAVDAHEDNMLKITSDGRKLGLDQRIINPMLPDEECTKVNQCVGNILQFWREGEDKKLTQLVFCDISTPKGRTVTERAAKTEGGNLDSPEIHTLETLVPLEPEEKERPFTIYADIRQKLIQGGMRPEQIAFIHDADTEVRKRELFAKVRSGQVRVLIGSTQKMGAGTNVQDRLIALHDLDCPWRPRDLTQRKGRIERQGNQNPLVHVCRYVTEGTFDAYLWQTVENKQKFISQIMTSKSPVRSCEDIDETALSFAEIKALCAGDPRIKERMDLDVDVAKLKIMKADHQSKQYRLEDQLLKYFPAQIEQNKGYIRGFEADMKTLETHPLPQEGYVGMVIRGDNLTDRENAGAALLDAIKDVKTADPVEIGSYRGFSMSVEFRGFVSGYVMTLKGEMSHHVELGEDPRGNLTRIDNALAKMPDRLKAVQAQLENLYKQQEAARVEVGKPFPYEAELTEKTARLVELDLQLNLSGGRPQPEETLEKRDRPSILERLKQPLPQKSKAKAKAKTREEIL